MREVSLIEEDDTQLSINEVREDSVKLETESNMSSIERGMPAAVWQIQLKGEKPFKDAR